MSFNKKFSVRYAIVVAVIGLIFTLLWSNRSAITVSAKTGTDQAVTAGNGKILFQKGFAAELDVPFNRGGELYFAEPGGAKFGNGSQPSYSRDGNKLVFLLNARLTLSDAGTYNPTSLVMAQGGSTIIGLYPRLSPDNTQVAYQEPFFSFYKIIITNTACTSGNENDSSICNSTTINEGDSFSYLYPSWLPTLTPSGANRLATIVFVKSADTVATADAGNATGDIWSMDVTIAPNGTVTQTGSRNLSKSAAKYAFPSYSPDGARILFEKDGQIWMMDKDGLAQHSVAHISGGVTGVLSGHHPIWSPDGNRIAFDFDDRVWTADVAIANDGTATATNVGNPVGAFLFDAEQYPTWRNDPSATASPSPSPVATLAITADALTSDGVPLTGPVSVGQNFKYRFNVTNNGPATATGIKVVDGLPGKVTFISDNKNICTVNAGTVTCNFVNLVASDHDSVVLTVRAETAGVANNQATVEANEQTGKTFSNIVSTSIKLNNDNFANAEPISGVSGSSFSNNVGATKEVFSIPCFDQKNSPLSPCEPNHAGRPTHQSVWWKFRANQTGFVHFDTRGSQLDTVLAAYWRAPIFGGGFRLVERASNDDYLGGTSYISFKAYQGDDYYIAVDGYKDSAGDIFLNWSQDPEVKPAPVQSNITSLEPGFAKVKQVTSGTFNLAIRGSGFTAQSQVYVNGLGSGSLRSNRSVTPSEINVQLPASDLSQVGTLQIAVCGNSDSSGACGSFVSNQKFFDVIGYSTATISPGQVTTLCALDAATGKLKEDTCVTTNASTCPGPNPCTVTTAIYDAVQAAELNARKVDGVYHNLQTTNTGANSSLSAAIKLTGPAPTGSVLIGSTNANSQLLSGLNGSSLLGHPANSGFVNANGSLIISPDGASFTAAQYALSMKIISQDGASLRKGSATLVGEGGSLYNSTNGSFNLAAATAYFASIISQDGGSVRPSVMMQLLAQDGVSIISQDGGSIISQDGGSLLAYAVSLVAQGGGNLTGNLSSLTSNLYGQNLISPNGGTLISPNGGTLVTDNGSGLKTGKAGSATANGVDLGYKGWFVVTTSGGSVPSVTNTDDPAGSTTGVVNVTFDASSSPKISDVNNTVLTVVENPSVVQFSSPSFTSSEGSGAIQVTVARTGDLSLPLAVRYATVDGTAQQRTDFTVSFGTISFAANETSKTISIPVVDDGYQEAGETFSVMLKNPDVGVLGPQATSSLQITDNENPAATTNPLDNSDARFFVTQQYLDLLGRTPTEQELSNAATAITNCGSDQTCLRTQRVNFSSSIFNNAAFRQSGDFIFRVYQLLLNRQPTYAEFVLDRSVMNGASDLTLGKLNFVNELLVRQTLTDSALASLTAEQFVDRVNQNSGGILTQSERDAFVKGLQQHYKSQATVLQSVADSSSFVTLQNNRSFVTLLYFGYLRRDTDSQYAAWLQTLNQNGNSSALTEAFLTSTEYRSRFDVSACGFNLASVSTAFAATGGSGSVGFTAGASDCAWTAATNVSWITITSNASGTGNGSVNFTVAANSGAARVGTLTIGGQTFTVNQAASAGAALSASSYTIGEGGGSVQIVVTRTDTSGAATVDYATTDAAALNECTVMNGLGSSRCDYATSIGTLRFVAGEASKTIFIPIVDDAYAEGNETFTITLSNPTGTSLGTPATATVMIQDNETSNGPNPIDSVDFFIRQNYIDFLGREPDPAGLAGWRNVLVNCGTTIAQPCDRIEVSAGFFRSEEFQSRGYFIYRFYSAIGRIPLSGEFYPDFAKVSGFLTPDQLEANKVAYVNEVIARPEFQTKYAATFNNPTAYVDALLATVGLPSHPSRGGWITTLNSSNTAQNRALVLRQLVESSEVYTRYYNEAFVIMQYFGYLRRTADASYLNWIQTMNATNGDYRTMINGFMNSAEYRRRFGP